MIGGTSHCGKSTLAKSLSLELNIDFISTDNLAKHPGRPWKEIPKMIPEHVVDHYLNLSVEELLISVFGHYKKLWPTIRCEIELKRNEKRGMIIEGSAILPELIANNLNGNVLPVWLTASENFLRSRIYKTSGYYKKTDLEKQLIDAFVRRAIAFDQIVMERVKQFRFLEIHIDRLNKGDDLKKEFLRLIEFTRGGEMGY